MVDKIHIIPQKNENDQLSRSLNEITAEKKRILEEIFHIIDSEIIYSNKLLNDLDIKTTVENIIISRTGSMDTHELNFIRHNIIEKYYFELPALIQSMNLPNSILNQFPAALERLRKHLIDTKNIGYESNDDYYLKDICFVFGKSVPGGAQVIELYSHISTWRLLRSFIRPVNIFSTLKDMKLIKPGHWLRIHTEARYLADFNEQGWDECYGRIADMLSLKPQCKGMVGTSWFYDPALISISPNLSYLQKRPLDNGAIRIRHRTSRIDIERATLKSKTRRKLYQEGKYNPACYSIFWHKNELLEWANIKT